MTRRRGIILLVAVVAAVALGWWLTRDRTPVQAFETAEVRRGSLTDAITANGVINPISVINVGTQVSGTVQELNADFNDRVREGQILLRLDPALFASRLAASDAQLANARAQAQLQTANVRRAGELVAKDYISRQEYETLVASSRGSEAQVRQAAAQVAQDKANLEFSVIRAPVSGVVISREVDLGQTVAAAFATPVLFTIARDLSKMQIAASVAEADVARVQPGQRVVFTVDAYGTREFPGTVSQIRLNPETQQNVVTYTVIVDAANPDGALLPGMTVDARFQVATRTNVLLLPNGALGFRPVGYKPERGLAADEAVVFVAEGEDGRQRATPRRIRLGINDAKATEVVGGDLKAGERVITAVKVPETGGGMFSGPPGGRRESAGGGKGEEEGEAGGEAASPRAGGSPHSL
ncbi:efflux RND transporter periplasmic adaptor subunit [Polymorphobacter sp.]|uniref:efflux RND transporter periplasmic adaptor subunit n=1 Tax=Polymorphobacter sp. TaxID=1909290 RepID=UPI003F7158F1